MASLAALLYHPDGFDTSGERLMGRQAAGEAFLKAWVRYSGADPLLAWTTRPDHARDFKERVRGLGASAPTELSSAERPKPLIEAGALWLPGPDLDGPAWLRRRGPQNRWSIVGITHTTASARVMDAIAQLAIAPLQPWDALICTSAAVRATVEQVLGAQAEYLASRLGATRIELPQLPIIPLGVHEEDFAADVAARHAWRSRLGIGENEIAVLYLGRLSFHAKAHPLPMLIALERAAAVRKLQPHLVLAGWFANDGQERMFRRSAAEFAPSVRLHIVDGRVPDTRRTIWSAADLFTLLSDNIQETFGLAPVEAMAAGLPVVVSDWDGLKDTVQHGVHGFRIPTWFPSPGAGDLLSGRYEAEIDSYDVYIGSVAQCTAIDVDAAAVAYGALFESAELRRTMGAAGRSHVKEALSWPRIINRYRVLLDDLRRLRAEGKAHAPRRGGEIAHPARADPFHLFAGYPSRTLLPTTWLRQTDAGAAARLSPLHGASQVAGTPAAVPPLDALRALLLAFVVERQLSELLDSVQPDHRGEAQRGIGWLLKMGLLTARAG